MQLVQKAFIIPFIVACAMFIEAVDANIVVTALPSIARDFGRDPVALQIAVTSYVVGLGVFIPICGWMADRFGARRIFGTAIGLFIVASLLCAVAQSLAMLTVARFIQGIGGAMMVPVGRILIFRAMPRHELVRAMNYISLPALLGPAFGPLLGGFLTTYLHWRLVFLINLPIGLYGVWLTRRFIPYTREAHPGRLDWTGFVLSAIGGAVLLLGLSLIGGALVPTRYALVLCAIGATMVGSYVFYARRVALPLLDLRFFRIPTFQASVLGGSLFRIGLGAWPFLLPLSMQEAHGMTAFQAGGIACGSAVGGMFMKSLAPRALRRFGFRTTLLYNAAFAGVAIAICGLLFPGTPVWLIWLVVLLGGFFPALQFTGLNTLAYAEIKSTEVGRATSLASVVQQLSLGLGVTIAGMVVQATRALHGSATLGWEDFAPAYFVVGLFSLMSIPVTRRLAPGTGDDIARGHRAKE
ncbi:MFS transporter [Chitinasiproducens palmae]|uniref:Drug resistance transporter, EmrB/QacA subfamily n=1 Tax=Chitinasiproducens palmae TaxID=1770053 RepID=A0A1H2PNP4_9BURK|nr:MFS transporter [Chitinasiproducens palmae]SDV48311.1 drug resistance transporter, EmrB/QacA subfamily [Chitinasiproducens palmae]